MNIKPGKGWALFLTCRNAVRQDQIVFATDSMISHERVVKERDGLALKDQVKGKFFYKNAYWIFGLS